MEFIPTEQEITGTSPSIQSTQYENCDAPHDYKQYALAAEVPAQALEALIYCGYDTVSAVAEITEVKAVEEFLRENHFLLSEDSPRRARVYGVFEKHPEKFCFFPGHVNRIMKFVQNCKDGLKAVEAVAEKAMKANATNSYLEKPLIRKRKYRTGPRRKYKQALAVNTEGTPIGTTEEVLPLHSPLLVRDFSDSPEYAFAYNDVKNKLKSWSESHEEAEVRNLELDVGYKIMVTEQIHAPVEGSEQSGLTIEAFVLCCMCYSRIRLQRRRFGTFVISNATRHLMLCATNQTRPGKKFQQIPIDTDSGRKKKEVFKMLESGEGNDQVKHIYVVVDNYNNVRGAQQIINGEIQGADHDYGSSTAVLCEQQLQTEG